MICLRFQSTKVEEIFFMAKFFSLFFVKKQKIIAILGFDTQNRHYLLLILQAVPSVSWTVCVIRS